MKAVAFSNNGTALLCWISDAIIPDCLGFSIRVIDIAAGTKEPLPAWVPFEGQDNKDWQPKSTDVWPIQKFNWKFLTGQYGKTYQFEIVPMCGTPDNLTARQEMAVMTNKVTLTTEHGPISYACNNGILSTQWLARQLPPAKDGSGPDWETLVQAIKTPGNPIREKLSCGLGKFLMQPLLDAKSKGGRVYAAVYELSDPEIVQCFVDNADALSIILGNAGKDDDTNKDARQRLHAAGADITDRMLPEVETPHNKLYDYVGPDMANDTGADSGNPAGDATTDSYVQGGSANATPTGLCAQANAMMRFRSRKMVRMIREYWDRLKADGNAQSAEFRAANAALLPEVLLSDGKTRVQVFISPNTTERLKPKTNAPTPPDMQYIFNLMDGCRQMYSFLAFFPGFPSIISETQQLASSRPDLWIRGAVSSPEAMPRGAQLFHRNGEAPVMLPAEAIEAPFGDFITELLKAGPEAHAIIHSKTMAGDVFVPDEADCWCVIGSHNLGFKASYQNDEVIYVVRGNREVALAVFTHIMDVYDHYRLRYLISQHQSNFNGFLTTTADWQNKYFQDADVRKELQMLTGISLPDFVPANLTR